MVVMCGEGFFADRFGVPGEGFKDAQGAASKLRIAGIKIDHETAAHFSFQDHGGGAEEVEGFFSGGVLTFCLDPGLVRYPDVIAKLCTQQTHIRVSR